MYVAARWGKKERKECIPILGRSDAICGVWLVLLVLLLLLFFVCVFAKTIGRFRTLFLGGGQASAELVASLHILGVNSVGDKGIESVLVRIRAENACLLIDNGHKPLALILLEAKDRLVNSAAVAAANKMVELGAITEAVLAARVHKSNLFAERSLAGAHSPEASVAQAVRRDWRVEDRMVIVAHNT